jgi:hypothetical protein
MNDELKAAAERVAETPEGWEVDFGDAVDVAKAYLARIAADEAEQKLELECEGTKWNINIKDGVCSITDADGIAAHKSCDHLSTATHFAMALSHMRRQQAADASERIEREKPIDDEQVKTAAERRTKYLQWLESDGGDDTEFDWYEGAMAELDKQVLSAWAITRLAVEAKP